MNKKQMIERVRGNQVMVDVYTEKPNTYVKIKYVDPDNGEQHYQAGFAKVNYPDKFDSTYGVWLATEKAIYNLAKKLLKAKKK